MKQHITVKQLKELTNKQHKNLADLFFNSFIDEIATKDDCNLEITDSIWRIASSAITIGKMIEILETDHQITIDGNYEEEWSVVLYKKDSNRYSMDYYGQEKELCDALWKVLKNVIATND